MTTWVPSSGIARRRRVEQSSQAGDPEVAVGRDNGRMPPGHLRYYGSYRYASREALEQAVAAAWNSFYEEDVHPSLASMGRLVKQGDRLHVDLTLSTAADSRFAAAGMLQVLAKSAIDGAVEARHGSDHVDFFCSGEDD